MTQGQRCMARAKTCAGVAFKPQVVSQQRLTHKKKNPPAHVTVFERLTTLVSPLHKKHVISSKKPPQTRLSHAVHHSGGGITRMVSRQRKSGGSSARGWSGPAGGKSDVAGPRAFTLRQRSPTRRASSLLTQRGGDQGLTRRRISQAEPGGRSRCEIRASRGQGWPR